MPRTSYSGSTGALPPALLALSRHFFSTLGEPIVDAVAHLQVHLIREFDPDQQPAVADIELARPRMLLGRMLMFVSIRGSMPRTQGAPTCDWPLAGCGFHQHRPQDERRHGLDVPVGADDAGHRRVILHRLAVRQDS